VIVAVTHGLALVREGGRKAPKGWLELFLAYRLEARDLFDAVQIIDYRRLVVRVRPALKPKRIPVQQRNKSQCTLSWVTSGARSLPCADLVVHNLDLIVLLFFHASHRLL
jgi:hypothetical protein